MATIATPRKRLRIGRVPIIIGIVLLLLIGGAAAWMALGGAAAAPPQQASGWQTVEAKPGPIDATVSATGNVEAKAESALRFAVTGNVAEVLVQPGDQVTAGQPLARIAATDLELTVAQREADLKDAQAALADLRDGATPQEIADAQAQIARARGAYQRTAGSVSQADVAAARAKLDQAKAQLARLSSGVETADRADAEAALQQAQSALAESRASLASAKESARLDMELAANALRNKQDEFSKVYWDNRKLEGYGKLPQDRIDAEVTAKRDVADAEAALNQKRIAYDEAKQNEIATLQTREADVRKAQASLDKVLAGPRAEDLAEARAAVQSAQAELNKLTGANRSGDLAAAQADIDAAQAGLDKLTADPKASELAKGEAAVAKAEAALKQAQSEVAKATLTAPFAATVASVDMNVGEPADTESIITVVDMSSFHIDVPVDELDVAQLSPGQAVRVALDALPDAEVQGTLTNIAPLATENDRGTTTYEVTVAVRAEDVALRPGMTAVVQIVTRNKADALLVPRRAVQSENGQSYVLVPAAGQPDPATGRPASERRNVTLGLSNNESIEIVSGLKAGEKVLVADVVQVLDTGVN
jgi:HlyD family secretion protein